MHLFHLARHPTQAIHIAFVALLLAFGFSAFAHASHRHDSDNATSATALHAAACGYCAVFGSLSAAPQATPFTLAKDNLVFSSSAPIAAAILRPIATSAHPRAPPRQ